MRELRTYGSVRGAPSNGCPYRDRYSPTWDLAPTQNTTLVRRHPETGEREAGIGEDGETHPFHSALGRTGVLAAAAMNRIGAGAWSSAMPPERGYCFDGDIF